MSRRPPEDRGAVVFLHKDGLTTAEICRMTGFDRRFVKPLSRSRQQLLLQNPHSSKVSFSALHPPRHRVSQSRCISISSASRIDGRIQSCDKSQESSSRLCAGKLLRLDLRAVCATCVPAVKNRKNPVPTKTQNLEH